MPENAPTKTPSKLRRPLDYPVVGVEPQDRLPITARLWRDAHGQHGHHRLLHGAYAHRPGIVYGLDVVVSTKDPKRVWVTPGVAVDGEGVVIVHSEPASYEFELPNTSYLKIAYDQKVDLESLVQLDENQSIHANFVEYRRIWIDQSPPNDLDLELARIERSVPDAKVREPRDPFDPGRNELNRLCRRLSFPYCRVDGCVGEAGHVPKVEITASKPNRPGLVNLVRAANDHGFHLDFAGPYPLDSAVAWNPLLLYLSGKEAFLDHSDAEVSGLASYLRDGGLLFGDASRGDAEFVACFIALAHRVAKALGRDLQWAEVGRGHPLLAADSRFAVPPSGGQESGTLRIDEAAGILLSTYDYGGAWQGAVGDPRGATSRERIRQAEEFGLNVVAYAADRARVRALAELAAT